VEIVAGDDVPGALQRAGVAVGPGADRFAVGARDVGADLCLAKPCLPSQVARVVRAMLFRSRLSPAAAAAV